MIVSVLTTRHLGQTRCLTCTVKSQISPFHGMKCWFCPVLSYFHNTRTSCLTMHGSLEQVFCSHWFSAVLKNYEGATCPPDTVGIQVTVSSYSHPMTKLPQLIFIVQLEDYCGSSSTASTAMSHPVPAFMVKSMSGNTLTNLGVIWTVWGPELSGPVMFSRLEIAYESRILPQ